MCQQVSGPAFHTMCLSTDHTKLIGLSFDCVESAKEMWQHIEQLTADPENISLSVPKKNRKIKKKQRAQPLPQKSHISQPCCFQVTTASHSFINSCNGMNNFLFCCVSS